MRFIQLLSICLLMSIFSSTEALVLNDMSYYGKLTPGESKQVKVSLYNEKEEAEEVIVYQSDYACNPEGEHFFDDPGTLQRSNASWITLHNKRFTIPAKSKSEFFYTINVPEKPTQGSYWSIVLVEPVIPVKSVAEAEKEGVNLTVKVRYAHPVVTDIGEGLAKLKVVGKGFKTINDKKVLYVDVMNDGERYLSPKLNLKLYNSQGKLEKALDGGRQRLYPGYAQRYYIDPDELHQDEKYTAFLLLDNGDNNLFGDKFQLSSE